MDKVKVIEKHKRLVQALATLQEAFDTFDAIDSLCSPDKKEKREQLERALRDSVIKRFEYCVDLFWKYLQVYLEKMLTLPIDEGGPKNIFRYCLQVKVLTEQEVESAFELIESRNRTSHIYREEIADFVAKKAPSYYEYMCKVVQKTKP